MTCCLQKIVEKKQLEKFTKFCVSWKQFLPKRIELENDQNESNITYHRKKGNINWTWVFFFFFIFVSVRLQGLRCVCSFGQEKIIPILAFTAAFMFHFGCRLHFVSFCLVFSVLVIQNIINLFVVIFNGNWCAALGRCRRRWQNWSW